ncbi:MAG: redoxin domain-containing protein [Thermoanaerobaculia bacterium]
MSNLRRSTIAALAFAAALAALAAKPPATGQQAPDFTLTDQNGRAVTLSSARGHKVVLVFYRGYW